MNKRPDLPPPPKIGPMATTPYATLEPSANVQQWRNAFGLLQTRCKALEQHIKELSDYIYKTIPDYVSGRIAAIDTELSVKYQDLELRLLDLESGATKSASFEETGDYSYESETAE